MDEDIGLFGIVTIKGCDFSCLCARMPMEDGAPTGEQPQRVRIVNGLWHRGHRGKAEPGFAVGVIEGVVAEETALVVCIRVIFRIP